VRAMRHNVRAPFLRHSVLIQQTSTMPSQHGYFILRNKMYIHTSQWTKCKKTDRPINK